MPTKGESIHLVGAGPKRCCHCKNDRPCNCGCVCEDMTNLDDSGNTPTTSKQPNPNEDCYKAMPFNDYNYADDPGQPTCQDPYEEPFIGPKAPCWMFVAKDCGDHQKCTQEEALTVCDDPEESIECDGEVIPVLKCYECPCTCETVSKLSGMAEGIFFNSKASCDEWRVDDDPGTQDCDKCVEVPFPEGESGSLCDDLRNNYINCAGNSACIGQQASTTCWTIVDKQCSDLGSGCVGKSEPEGVKCEPSESEADCPLLQNCYSSCPNGTFVSKDDCDQYLEDEDSGCYKCEPCASADLANCWCLEPKTCSEISGGQYDDATACDNALVSANCEGCAYCYATYECEEQGLDCHEIQNYSCGDLGGSYTNKPDCDADLVATGTSNCYECLRITDCDECWSRDSNPIQCWGVFPMSCSKIGGMSEAECDLQVQISADGPCLKCVDANCPETPDCFLLQGKTCVEMGCDEFCDPDQCAVKCPDGISGGKCPECVKCEGGCASYGLYAENEYADCANDCDAQEDGCGICRGVNPAGVSCDGAPLFCYECQQNPCQDQDPSYYNSCSDCKDARFPIDPDHCIKCTGPYCNYRCHTCEYKTCSDWARYSKEECEASFGECRCVKQATTPDYGAEKCVELDNLCYLPDNCDTATVSTSQSCGSCMDFRCPDEDCGNCCDGGMQCFGSVSSPLYGPHCNIHDFVAIVSVGFDNYGSVGSLSCSINGNCNSCGVVGTIRNPPRTYYAGGYFKMILDITCTNSPHGGPYGWGGAVTFAIDCPPL